MAIPTPHLPLLLFGTIGTPEIILIGVAVFLLFGAKKIPELMRSLGRAQGEFANARKQFEAEVKAGEKKTKEPDLDALRKKAEALGLDADGKDADELQRAIEAAEAKAAA